MNTPEREALIKKVQKLMVCFRNIRIAHGNENKEYGFTSAKEVVDEVEQALSDNLQSKVIEAEHLCEIYFNIASSLIGEDEVRRIRDEAIKEVK